MYVLMCVVWCGVLGWVEVWWVEVWVGLCGVVCWVGLGCWVGLRCGVLDCWVGLGCGVLCCVVWWCCSVVCNVMWCALLGGMVWCGVVCLF